MSEIQLRNMRTVLRAVETRITEASETPDDETEAEREMRLEWLVILRSRRARLISDIEDAEL